MSIISDLRNRNVFRVAAAYVVAGWLVVQVVETVFPAFGFGDAAIRWVVIALAVGLIPVLLFSWAFELTPEGLKREKDINRSIPPRAIGRRLDIAIIALLLMALGYLAVDKFVLDPRRDAADAILAAEEIARAGGLIDSGRHSEAFLLARELAPRLRNATRREELWSTVSRTADLVSEPPGADVWMRPYHSTESDWRHLGRTPLQGVRVPRALARFRLELAGHQTIEVARNWTYEFHLEPDGGLPEGMVRVPGGEFTLFMPGLEHLEIELPDFFIDAHEVTNRQYQAFVDAGGYTESQYWVEPVIQNGRELSFEEAMVRFLDQTGRPGPATWSVGRHPEGQAEQPVSGISWYEAMAYARYAGKQLPTVFHWYRAAGPYDSEHLLPASNFSGSAAPVGKYPAISRCGASDMAGNAREWIWNHSGDLRFILGGGWDDQQYMFTDANAQSPLDRSPTNGLRLMVIPDDTNLGRAREPIAPPNRDYLVEQPVADDLFEVYRRQYQYDRTALNAKVVDSALTEGWIRDEIQLDAAYGNERLTAFLYLPQKARLPYRPIIFFPGSNAIHRGEAPRPDDFFFRFLMDSGHAVLLPIYLGTYSRGTELRSDIQNESNSYRQHVIAWYRDMARALDYLETRPEIDMKRLAYFGVSWGAAMAPIMVALEPRITTTVALAGGLVLQPTQPEVDPFNFLPRVTVPAVMINVPNDFFYPLESSQKPFFRFLGSSEKEHVLFEGGHVPPINDVVRETLAWLDRYPGPVE